jgi:hypothetical protein
LVGLGDGRTRGWLAVVSWGGGRGEREREELVKPEPSQRQARESGMNDVKLGERGSSRAKRRYAARARERETDRERQRERLCVKKKVKAGN